MTSTHLAFALAILGFSATAAAQPDPATETAPATEAATATATETAPATATAPATVPAPATAPPPAPAAAAPLPPTPPALPALPAIPEPPIPPTPPSAPIVVFGDDVGDRITFGSDAYVAAGERVRDVVTMGGDAIIAGEVTGDVVTMGGDLRVREGAVVHGEVVTMGGDVQVDDGATLRGGAVQMPGPGGGDGIQLADGDNLMRRAVGPWESLGEWIYDALTSAVSFALLFLFGLVLMGLAPQRMTALHAAIIRDPIRTVAHGLLAFVATAVAIVALCITVIGIPFAVILALVTPVAVYIGLAAVASVVGAALPIKRLGGKPVLQLAAGVGAMFIVSLVPYLGALVLAIASAFGIGALVITRFRDQSAADPSGTPNGPYRTATPADI